MSSNTQSKPLSFVSWLQQFQRTNTSEAQLLAAYSKYIQSWHASQSNKGDVEKQAVIQSYQNIFKEIALNYTTQEEKRFLTNLDYTNPKDLDIAVPFFVRKLKEISQYFVGKREEVAQSRIKHSFSGNSFGLIKNIQHLIFSLVSNKDFTRQFQQVTFPSLSALLATMKIAVNELYDTTTYFDALTGEEINPLTILDIQQGIQNALAELPLGLATNPDGSALATSNNEQILINVTRTDIQDLPYSDFLNSIKQQSNLDLTLLLSFYQKYFSTAFYFLSTGSTTTDIVSGVLLKPSNAYGNILNRNYPTIATVPNLDNFQSVHEIGECFVPSKLGLLCFSTFAKDYSIDVESLSGNTVYIFPEPLLYQKDGVDFISIREDVSPFIADSSNGALANEIINRQQFQQFFPYQSRNETLKYQPEGINRSSDLFNFFTGTADDIWANADIYPAQILQPLPIQQRINDLVVTDDTLVQWCTDIFGNEYGLYKPVMPKRDYSPSSSPGYFDTAYESTNSYNSISQTNTSVTEPLPIATKQATLGAIFVRTINAPTVSTLLTALSSVFLKYQANTQLTAELTNSIKWFTVIEDVIVVQTSNFIVAERFSFDLSTGTFSTLLGKTTVLSLSGNDLQFCKPCITSKNVVVAKLTKSTPLSASSINLVLPYIYTIDLESLATTLAFNPLSSASVFSVEKPDYTDTFTTISQPILTFSQHEDSAAVTFSVITNAHNLLLYNYRFDVDSTGWHIADAAVVIPTNI